MNQQKQQDESKIKKCDDEITECKKHKHFLDILAIQAKLKPYNPKSNFINE